MKTIFTVVFFSIFAISFAYGQEDTQEQLLQKYQAMVIVEEANQHCPLLSRIEAEALNGQIVFANGSFSGKLDMVEKFKKEARIFVRRMACDAPEIMGLIGLARQEASDSMINHLLLSRQIHLFDLEDSRDGKINRGLLLDYMSAEEWQLIEELYQDVHENYLKQASEEVWGNFIESIEKVAQDKTAEKYLQNEQILKTGAPGDFRAVQAMATNREITSYYYNLEKTVLAFVEGASADDKGYPYTRPANDFTNWTAFRPRTDELNWVMSYPGCGGSQTDVKCTLFTNQKNEIGVVLQGDVRSVSLDFRNPDDQDTFSANKAVEGPIGSNELNENNMNDNARFMDGSETKNTVSGISSDEHDKYRAQTGTDIPENSSVYIFPKETLASIEKLHKNDVVKLTVEVKKQDGNEQWVSIIPVHNYHRAKNWAYSTQ